jgi:hypothetical protein
MPKTPVRAFDPAIKAHRMVNHVPVERRYFASTPEGIIWEYRLPPEPITPEPTA